MKTGLGFVSPTTFVLQRFIVSAVALSPILLLLRKKVPHDRGTLGKLVLLGLINVSSITAMNVGLVNESSGLGAVLSYTQPLFVLCLAIPFLKEKITKMKLLGATIGFIGVVILFRSSMTPLTFNSALIMLLGAFLWAVNTIYYKKCLVKLDPLVANFFQLLVGAFPLIILSIVTNSFILPRDAAYTWIVLYNSVGAIAVGSTVWFFLLKEQEATVLSSSAFIVPVVALLLGWQLMGEDFDAESVLGSALVLLGVIIVNLKRYEPEKMPKP
jgi:drug/metabolite transporter (DMT)-like permease